MSPKVSVVVPAFNNARTISATLTSILEQDYDSFEVIVSDHQSSDSTVDEVKPFLGDKRVQLHHFDGPAGAEANWTFVTQLAHGEYVVLVCGDDLLLAGSLKEKATVLDSHPEVVLVANQKSVVSDDNNVIVSRRGLAGLTGQVSGMEAMRRSVRRGQNLFGEPACTMFRRDAWQQVGRWVGDDPYVIDQATYFALLQHGDFYALPDVLSSFRLSKSQLSFRLVSQQARQVEALHANARRTYPDHIRAGDVAVGNALARVNAALRRVAYWFI